MDRLAPQLAHDFCDVILLKKPDRGDAGSAYIKASVRILDRNPTQGKHGNALSAGFAEPVQSSGSGLRCTFLFKHRREHAIVCPLRRSTRDCARSMA